MSIRIWSVVLVAVSCVGAMHAPLFAQRPADGPLTPDVQLDDRLWGGLTFGLQIPQGEFGELAGVGFELRANLLVDMVSDGLLGLRLSGTGAYYPDRSFGPPTPGVGSMDVGNRIVSFNIGPQLTAPSGALRPYGFASAGAAFVRTNSSLGGTLGPDPYVPAYSDLTHVLSIGGGLYVPISTGSRSVALDLGVEHRWNGDTRFLGGSSVLSGQSGLVFDPIDVNANVVVLELGVAVGL